MAEPLTFTLRVADNPLAGRPGQNDITVTVAGEPELPLRPDGTLNPDDHARLLESPAFCATVAALAHLVELTAETVVLRMPWGSPS